MRLIVEQKQAGQVEGQVAIPKMTLKVAGQKSAVKIPPKPKDLRTGWEKHWQEMADEINSSQYSPYAIAAQQSTGRGGLSGVRSPAAIGPRQIASTLSWIPFAKYVVPEEAMKLSEMDASERNSALAWEAVGLGLMTMGPLISKYGGKAVNGLQNYLKKRSLLKLEPVEDALHKLGQKGGVWKGYDYRTEAANRLRNMGFATDEASAIADTIATGSADDVGLRALAWEKGDKLSKAWKKNIGQIGEKIENPDGATLLRRQLTLSDSIQQTTKPENVHSYWARKLYKENLKRSKVSPNVHHLDNMIHEYVGRVYGTEMASKLDLGYISESEMANLVSSLFTTRGKRTISMMHRLGMSDYLLPWMMPERFVYGAGEAVYHTKSKVFDKLLAAQRAANGYRVDLGNTFMTMLQQRGFGKIVKKSTGSWTFKPNKALYNDKTLDGAKEVLRKIDDIAEAGRRGKVIDTTEARAQINQLLNKLKEDSPTVFELVDLTHSFTDVLYKDMLQQYVPKIVNRLPLNQQGRAYISQMTKLWGTRAEQLFSTASSANATEKISFTKKLLADFRKAIKKPEFYDNLTKSQQALVDNTLSGLTYGGKSHLAMPAYLEGYMPRVPMRGEQFAGYAKSALVGKASYTYRRKQQGAGQLVETFQEMIGARIGAQAKQMHFYHEAGDVIDYARTLPDAWRAHTDFTISRMIGQPSNWDHKVATVLSKIPGTGSWDEYRAMKAAKTITGMQYAGLLGLRPFAVFRNLTQPLLMTPPEMGGGVRDVASLVRGLGRVADPKHRKYIQEIGAITDFLPDQQVRPLLPKLGIGAQWNNIRDAFLYFYRNSDKFNRYWSGAAAIEKWNWATGQTGEIKHLGSFMKKLGLRHRSKAMQTEIRNLLELGRIDEAKKLFVRDVIENTQYIYNTANSPSLMGSGGAQRLVSSFNSWWMNYGAAVSRWATTGQASDRIKRIGMGMLTAAATEQLLESWAGRRTAIRSVGIGPFPLGDASMPPALAPIWHMLGAAKQTAQGYMFDDQASRQAGLDHFYKAMKQTAVITVPGGLMMQQAARGYARDEWPGLMMGILQKTDKEFEPLFGLGE